MRDAKMGEVGWKLCSTRSGGRKVGSRIRVAGGAFGLELSVDEVATERNPPFRKVWETTGTPKTVGVSASLLNVLLRYWVFGFWERFLR